MKPGVRRAKNTADQKMKAVKAEQLAWITERGAASEKATAKYEGGTLESYSHAGKLAEQTKERSCELVRKVYGLSGKRPLSHLE